MNPEYRRALWQKLLVVTTVILALGIAQHWVTVQIGVVASLQTLNWPAALGVQKSQPDVLTSRCLTNRDCARAWGVLSAQRFDGRLWYAPLAALGLTILVSLAFRDPFGGERKNPGGARWAERRDLQKMYLGEVEGRVGSLGVFAKQPIRLPENLRCAHTLIIGGTGAGKTTRYVMPNLLLDARDGVSAVVFDLKYPDPRSGFLDCINYFVHFKRQVYPFTPFDPDSARLSLFSGINTIQDAFDIAESFRPAGGASGDSFFYNNELLLLGGLIYAVAQEPQPSFRGVYNLLSLGVEPLKAHISKFEELRSALGVLLDLKDQIVASACTGLAGDLSIFLDANLDRAFSPGPGIALDLEQLCRQPSFLYIGIPQEQLQGGKGQALLRLLKRLLDRAILKVCGEHSGRLPVHLSLYLDEFPSFGLLPNIAENLATMRSRRVAFHIAMQNRAQGEALYGKDGFRGMVNNNFAQIVVFPRSLRMEDAQYFAESLGTITVTEDTYTESTRGGFMGFGVERGVARGHRLAARPLLSADEMRIFPDGYAVIEMVGVPPVKVQLPRLDERTNPYRKLFERIKAGYPTPKLRRPGVQAPRLPALAGDLPPWQAPLARPTTRAVPASAGEWMPVQRRDAVIQHTKTATETNQAAQSNADAASLNPSAESLRSWVSQLIEEHTALVITLEAGQPTQIDVPFGALAPEQAQLEGWLDKGYVVRHEATLCRVQPLGLTRLNRFKPALIALAQGLPAPTLKPLGSATLLDTVITPADGGRRIPPRSEAR